MAPWWLRWLWLNLMLAAVISVCYLLSVSLEEIREWLAADGYFERRRERHGAVIPGVLALIQVAALFTVYRSGAGDAGRLALIMAGLIGVVLLALRWFEHASILGATGSTPPPASERWLVAYIVASHLGFAVAGWLRQRAVERREQPLDVGLGHVQVGADAHD